MDALSIFLIYVLPFLAIGIGAKWWMRRRGVGLDDVQSQAGSGRRRRRVFLLGFWCWEDDP